MSIIKTRPYTAQRFDWKGERCYGIFGRTPEKESDRRPTTHTRVTSTKFDVSLCAGIREC